MGLSLWKIDVGKGKSYQPLFTAHPFIMLISTRKGSVKSCTKKLSEKWKSLFQV